MTKHLLALLAFAWLISLAQPQPKGFNDFAPDWSPDGTKIVFVSDRDGNSEIYLLTIAPTTDLKRLTAHPGSDLRPRFSRWTKDRVLFEPRRQLRNLYNER